MVIADVWESEEALGRFFEEKLGPAVRHVGLSEPEPRMLPVHNRLRGSADEGNMVMLIEIANASTDTYDAMTAEMDAHAQDGGHPHTPTPPPRTGRPSSWSMSGRRWRRFRSSWRRRSHRPQTSTA